MYCKLLNWVHSTLHRLKSMWNIPSLCGEPLPKRTEGNICRDLCLFLLNTSDHVKTILPHQTPLPQSPRKKNCLCVNDWLHHIQKCVESAGIGGCGGLTGGTSAGNQWALSPYGVRASWAHEWSQRSGVVSGCGVMAVAVSEWELRVISSAAALESPLFDAAQVPQTSSSGWLEVSLSHPALPWGQGCSPSPAGRDLQEQDDLTQIWPSVAVVFGFSQPTSHCLSLGKHTDFLCERWLLWVITISSCPHCCLLLASALFPWMKPGCHSALPQPPAPQRHRPLPGKQH